MLRFLSERHILTELAGDTVGALAIVKMLEVTYRTSINHEIDADLREILYKRDKEYNRLIALLMRMIVENDEDVYTLAKNEVFVFNLCNIVEHETLIYTFFIKAYRQSRDNTVFINLFKYFEPFNEYVNDGYSEIYGECKERDYVKNSSGAGFTAKIICSEMQLYVYQFFKKYGEKVREYIKKALNEEEYIEYTELIKNFDFRLI